MTAPGRTAEDSVFVRTYTLTRGRTAPRHRLGLETVLEAGPGRPGPGQAEECARILALCRERHRSVAELAGLLRRPVTAIKILVSDLVDADALVVPVTSPYAASSVDSGAGPSPQMLAAVTAGLRKKFPDAVSYAHAG
ncbi:DUF742 domain-containing protein [Streptomyces sp. p1417]|uniref:DUF742 domain-containing protein n=1 Tax=Streptomyces typhae TaxID=2681492 RepID=A0A6L6X8I5_9ACTN|nr:DUF742 domain-containing protein [Streptomyces typhae]